MGFDFERVVGESKELLKCLICLDVVKDAIQLKCCQQLFCRKCIDDWLTHNNNSSVGNCPFDRTRITRRKIEVVPRIVNSLLETLTIKCQYITNGCKTVTKLSQIEEHEKECDYRTGVLVECECGLYITRKDMVYHNCIKFLSQKMEFMDKKFVELNTEIRKMKRRLSARPRVVTPFTPKRLKKVLKRPSNAVSKSSKKTTKKFKKTLKRLQKRRPSNFMMRRPSMRRQSRPKKRASKRHMPFRSPLRRRFLEY